MTPNDADAATPPARTERLFQRGADGRLATTSVAAREDVERFASALRGLTGPEIVEARFWPFRKARLVCWSLEVVSFGHSLSLTFSELGRTHLPNVTQGAFEGEVTDAVDAYCLLEFLT